MSKLLITGIGGGVGLHITKSLTEQGYMDIVGVDVNPETQARLKSESPIPLYASLAEAMAAEDIGGIYICTPDATHRDVAVEALTYGLPVLCEKPMGNRPEEAREMLEAAQASQGWLQIAFEYRFSPAFWRVHEIVESREVGAPLNVFNEYTPGPWGPNAPWRLDPAKNPGVFNEKLCHIVDLFRFWMEDEITQVQAFRGLNSVPWYPPEIADNVLGVYRFRRGGLGILVHNHVTAADAQGMEGQVNVLSWTPGADMFPFKQAGHSQRCVVICERGTVICDIWGKTVVVNERVGTDEMRVKRVEDFREWRMLELSHDMVGEVLDFIHRFENGLPPRIDPEDSYHSSLATLASEESLRSGAPVRLE